MEAETESGSQPGDSGHPQSARRRMKHLVRGPGGPVGGVATGIANYLGIDPLVVQIGFVAGAFVGGVGLLLYIAGWLLIPAFDQNPAERQGVARLVLGSLGLAAGALAVLAMSNNSLTIAVVLVAAGCYLLLQRPDEAAALGSDVKDLLRPRGGTVADRSWGTPQTDGADLGRIGYVPAGYQPPPPHVGGSRRARRRTTKSGPPITSVTLAICALAAGLSMRLDISDPMRVVAACSATLTLCGLGLIVGSVLGRARGLIAVGMLAALGIVIAAAAAGRGGNLSFGDVRYDVTSEATLADRYSLSAGELVVDLSELDLTADRTLEVTAGAASVIVVLPESIAADVTGKAGIGDVTILGANEEQPDAEVRREYRPVGYVQGDPVLTLEVDIGVGEIEVQHGN